jgi:DNA-directed RNA polymerase subunit beta'
MIKTTVGKVIFNQALPSEYRDYTSLTSDDLKDVLDRMEREMSQDAYRKATKDLHRLGAKVAYETGVSLSIDDLAKPPKTRMLIDRLKRDIKKVSESPRLTDDQKNKAIVGLILKNQDAIQKTMFDESAASGNSFAEQVMSKARGKLSDMRSIIVGNLLVADNKDRVVPIPMLRSYSEGLDPAEYWAGAYGARKGLLSTKIATADTGFYGKQLKQAAHRLVVTENDCKTDRGMVVDREDKDNLGALLAKQYGDYPAGTVITPEVLDSIEDDEIVVRSPVTCNAAAGVCSRCAGIREKGGFPDIGENVGMSAAQAVAEPTTQMALNVKHQGGRIDKEKKGDEPSGFELVNQLIQVPKSFRGAAAVSSKDGTVTKIEDSPQGGKYIYVSGQKHHINQGFDPVVKEGDRVYSGDVLSTGIPNPSDLVKYKGLGEGRREFIRLFKKAYTDQGININRRNVELVARGLVNHVHVNDIDGVPGLPGDILEYSSVERKYKPRYGTRHLPVSTASNKYLEKPVLHYSIGTRITKPVLDKLKKHNVKYVEAHDDPPPFNSFMLRALENLAKTPDWQARLGGFYLKDNLLEAAHRGRESKIHSESYIPSLVQGKDFGKKLYTKGEY